MAQDTAEMLQFAAGGKFAKQQKPRNFLISETILFNTSIYYVIDINSAVSQLSLVWYALAVGNQIAMHIAYQSQARHNTCAVRVAKPALNIVKVKFIGRYFIVFPVFTAKFAQLRMICFCLIFFCMYAHQLHRLQQKT